MQTVVTDGRTDRHMNDSYAFMAYKSLTVRCMFVQKEMMGSTCCMPESVYLVRCTMDEIDSYLCMYVKAVVQELSIFYVLMSICELHPASQFCTHITTFAPHEGIFGWTGGCYQTYYLSSIYVRVILRHPWTSKLDHLPVSDRARGGGPANGPVWRSRGGIGSPGRIYYLSPILCAQYLGAGS